MNQTLLSLLVGLLAGTAGALAINMTRAETPGPGTGAALPAGDLGDLPQRLERIEALLRDRPLTSGPTLEGTQGTAAAVGATSAQLDALVERLEERLRPTIQESVKSSMDAALADSGSIEFSDMAADAKKQKKKVTLAELSAELELSAAEEEEVRRITDESTEAFLKLLVEEGESLEDLRAEFKTAKGDPAKQAALGLKYMGKIMTNIGPMITLGMEHDTKMAQAIGKEKADRLDEEFEVTDLDPMGLEGIFDTEK